MKYLETFFMGKKEYSERNSVIWNLFASGIYALQSAVLLLVVSRVSGLYDAGVFSIAYTVTQMMGTIGTYGMRNFQVSDVKNEYSYSTYYSSRIISTLAMVLICISYALLQKYNFDKMMVVTMLCGYRVVDDIEDVFHGEFQRCNRLDVASKILGLRILLASIFFTLTYCVSRNLIFASFAFFISALMLAILFNGSICKKFSNINLKFTNKNVLKLLVVCLPICLSSFLYTYLVNAPKYAIDRNLSEEMQSIFSILFMPIFAINLLSSIIFKPIIATMSVNWYNKQYRKFMKSIAKQSLLISLITVFAALSGWLFGVQILGAMYNVDLLKYRLMFTILIAFGGLAAFVAFFVVVLTIMRKQIFIIVAYGVATLCALAFIDSFVKKHLLLGASIAYGMTMFITLIIMLLVFIVTIYVRKVKEK